jgi:programmed cell death protein 5
MDEGPQAANLQAALQKRAQELQRQQQAEQQARQMLKGLLTAEAYERMMNIRLSSPELYAQLLQMVAYLAQRGQVSGSRRLGEEELKKLGGQVLAKTRRESRITRLNK